jgi:hypothetical protein
MSSTPNSSIFYTTQHSKRLSDSKFDPEYADELNVQAIFGIQISGETFLSKSLSLIVAFAAKCFRKLETDFLGS